MRRPRPRHVLTLVAVTLILASFVAPQGADQTEGVVRIFAIADDHFSSWFGILAVFAFILGGASLLRSHGRKIRLRQKDWAYSVVTLVSFFVVLIVGFCKLGGPPGLRGDLTAPDSWLTRIFEAVLSPLHATLYALLAFYVASASYRAFRIRSLETTVLLGSALIVLLGRLPASIWPVPVGAVSSWLLAVPNTAGQRALMIGIALGVVALAVRMMAGLERDGRRGGADA